MPRYDKFSGRDTIIADEGDVAFTRLNTRLRPDQIRPTEVAGSVNGRMDIDGAWQTRKGIDSFGPVLAGNEDSIRLLATPTWKLYSGTVSISSATRSSATVTVNTSSSHGYSDQTIVYVAGLAGTVNPNGNRLITVTTSTQFTFTIAGSTGSETYGGTGTVEPAELSGTATTGVYGSCLFSDPSSTNATYIIRATNSEAIAVRLSTGVATSIAYPSGVSIGSNVNLLQVFDKVLIFRPGGLPALSMFSLPEPNRITLCTFGLRLAHGASTSNL